MIQTFLFITNLRNNQLTTKYLLSFIAPYRASSIGLVPVSDECRLSGFGVLYLCPTKRR